MQPTNNTMIQTNSPNTQPSRPRGALLRACLWWLACFLFLWTPGCFISNTDAVCEPGANDTCTQRTGFVCDTVSKQCVCDTSLKLSLCTPTAQQGQSAQAKVCVDLTANSKHCGGCNKACPAGYVCEQSLCTLPCPQGQQACNNQCVDIQTSNAHCGGCDLPCEGSGFTCVTGACVFCTDDSQCQDPLRASCSVTKGGCINGFRQWQWLLPYPTPHNINAIAHINSVLIAVGDDGLLMRSSRAGFSFQALPKYTSAHLYGVSLSSTEAMAVGDKGTILLSNNEGQTWRLLKFDAIAANTWRSIHLTKNVAILVGDKGAIARLTKQGGQWALEKTMTSPSGEGVGLLRLLAFEEEITSYGVVALGQKGTLIGSKDLGSTWEQLTTPTQETLLDLRYTSATKGTGVFLIVGTKGTLLRAETLGPSWQEITSPKLKDTTLFAIAVGDPTSVLYASDGRFFLYDTSVAFDPKQPEVGEDKRIILQGAVKEQLAALPNQPKLRALNVNSTYNILAGERGILLRSLDTNAQTPWGLNTIQPNVQWRAVVAQDLSLIALGQRGSVYLRLEPEYPWLQLLPPDDTQNNPLRLTQALLLNEATSPLPGQEPLFLAIGSKGDRGALQELSIDGAVSLSQNFPPSSTLQAIIAHKGSIWLAGSVDAKGALFKDTIAQRFTTGTARSVTLPETHKALLSIAANNAILPGAKEATELMLAVGEPKQPGQNTILRSTDQGSTWTPISVPAAAKLHHVAIAERFALAVGETSDGKGIILQSLDAGLTWTKARSTENPLYGVALKALLIEEEELIENEEPGTIFFALLGMAVGAKGQLWRLTATGEIEQGEIADIKENIAKPNAWVKLPAPSTKTLRSVILYGESLELFFCLIAGDDGILNSLWRQDEPD